MTSNSDEDSSEAVEHQSYDTFYKQHHGRLLARLARWVCNPDDARDLAQETFTKVLELDRLKFIQNPMAYLWTTARHALRKLRLHDKLVPVTYDSDAANHAANYPDNVARNELMDEIDAERHVLRAICELSPTHQRVVALYAQQLEVREIAHQLQISEHTVRKYITQAKTRIRTNNARRLAKRDSESDV